MAEMKFEKAIQRLEDIVGELEEGELSLDDSLKIFEEGIKASRFCSKKLDEVERKIEILMKTGDGKKKTKPFKIEGDLEEGNDKEDEGKQGSGKEEGMLF